MTPVEVGVWDWRGHTHFIVISHMVVLLEEKINSQAL